MKNSYRLVAWLPLVLACGTDSGHSANSVQGASGSKAGTDTSSSAARPDASQPAAADASAQPIAQSPGDSASFDSADTVTWSTDQFSVNGGQEKYLCFARTLDDSFTINGYRTAGQPFVHHLIFARAHAPEPEGFAECDVAFRNTWEPIFVAGAGDTQIVFPPDAGHVLTKGTQLIVQMHLLNTADDPIAGTVAIDMRRSDVTNPRPVSNYIFGTAAVKLPPRATSTVVGNCAARQNVQLIGGLPHMHKLGTKMVFEAGASADDMHEVFKRDPFSFDAQRVDMLDAMISTGDMTRVTCTFDNTQDTEVDYGESTHDEMCYFVGFAVDQPAQSACIDVLPPDAFRSQ